MASLEQGLPPAGRCASRAQLHAWLARAEPGEQLEYHRGLLVRDRSPASELSEDERRTVAMLADAAFQAAEEGRVHLAQRRNGAFNFSYLAIKAATERRQEVTRHAA